MAPTTETPFLATMGGVAVEVGGQLFEIFELQWFEKIFLGVITVTLGVIGNALSFALLSRQKFRNTAAGFYMRALSLSDLGIMFGILGNHTLRSFDIPLNNGIYCKMVFFLVKSLGSVSDWTLAVMCLERSIAISMPLKSKEILKPKLNRIALAVILVLLLGYYSYVFVAYGSANGVCRTVSLSFPVAIRTLIDYLVVFIPAVVILGSNIVIVVCVTKAAKSQKKLTADSSASKSTHESLTAMLLSISIAFIIFKTPYFISKAVLPASVTKNIGYVFASRQAAVYRVVISVFTIMIYFNNAINFYLYILSGREYRQELRALFLRKRSGESSATTCRPATTSIRSAVTKRQLEA